MPSTAPPWRSLLRSVVEIAQTCRGYREWTLGAQDRLRQHYTFTVAEANKIFDTCILHPAQEVLRHEERRPDYEAPVYYDFYTHTQQGDIYFEFILDGEDDSDPVIQIVNVHPPSHKRKR